MADTTMFQVPELDPKLRKIAVRVARVAELAVEKVAANFAEPGKFPLAAEKSLEQILASRFKTLRPDTKKAAAANAINRINAPAAVRARRFGDIASVDLTKATAVEAQVRALPFPAELKLPKDYLSTLTTLHGQVMDSNSPKSSPKQTTNKLEFRIHEVACLDETNGFLGSEAGDDEIDLGGFAVDETGEVSKINAFRVGSEFDDGEKRVYSPPQRFCWFDMTEGKAWPKSYFVTLVLAEADMGGLPSFLNDVVDWAKVQLAAYLAESGVGIIAAAVVVVVGWIWDLFASIWEDDIFPLYTASAAVRSFDTRWPGDKTYSPLHAVNLGAHGGKYRIEYDWRKFA